MTSPSFPQFARRCGWDNNPDTLVTSRSLSGQQSCDAIIIGAGFTGLAIAKRLAKERPHCDIRVLDATGIGEGSAGRNSGFMLETVFKASTPQIAAQILPLYQAAHRDIRQTANLKTEANNMRIFKGAATKRGEHALLQLQQVLQRSNQPYTPLNAKQLQQITGSNYYLSGIELSGNTLVNPMQLVQSLGKSLAQSVQLHPHSPALSIEKNGQQWRVNTAQASLQAPQIFLANNAFIKGLGIANNRTITIYTYAGLADVPSDSPLAKAQAATQWGLLPAHRLGTTFRNTPSGQLLVRGMYSYEQEAGENVESTLLQSLKQRFPELESYQHLSSFWGGTTSLTANGAPIWGELQPGLFCSAGCNGVGIVKGWLLGSALADLAMQQPTLAVDKLFGRANWMPPEPLRKLGFLSLSGIEKQFAGNER